jgi:N-acetylmuramic acid 6-phosphate etherase
MTLSHLTTELRNPASERIDCLSALEIVQLMNAEDATVAKAVGCEAAAIARAIEIVARRLAAGGRLIYLGAGTSGRLGMLDAAECPPTFNSPPGQVLGIIAGGPAAMRASIEGAEDSRATGAEDLRAAGLSARDVVFGIATSGRTPYVLGGLEYARQIGAATVALTCNSCGKGDSPHFCEAPFSAAAADVTITPIVGPEVITGSTRLKAGTATKMVLNMVSTGAMVLLGKTYGNLMVDLRATNSKLVDRSRRIVAALTGLAEPAAETLLVACQGEVKTAVVASRCGLSAEHARQRLQSAGGRLRQALEGAVEKGTDGQGDVDGDARPGN